MPIARKPRCPICRRQVEPAEENVWFPFCSNRCKLIELSKWVNEEYRVPAGDEEEAGNPGDVRGTTEEEQ